MTRSLLAVVGFALSVGAFAEELYLPVNGNTRVRIANTSHAPTTVFIEVLGDKPTSTTLSLDAGKTRQWLRDGTGALRITSNDKIAVTATTTCASCGMTAKLPVLDARHLLDEGTIDAGVTPNELAWSSGVGIINPDNVSARVTLSLHRGETLVEQISLRVAARGARFLPMERIFRANFTGNERVTFTAPHDVLLFAYDANARSGARFFRAAKPIVNAGQPRRRAVRKTRSLTASIPQTIELAPSKDNMLVEDGEGSSSNGRGRIFSGATRIAGLRRALLAFDVAAQIPPGSRITRASLTMTVSRAVTGNEPMALHRMTADWGEGTSNTTAGTGALATPGDATWLHAFYPDRRWTTEGGDFDAAVDATANVGSFGPFTFDPSASMIARIQAWLDQPATNFGWMLLGNEDGFSSARGFDSRESAAERRPKLTVEFTR
ncbi:MAG TPA: DNRLRE domain-containing protein [Thermoanaerobaculia bacterium]|nr:DNRLRE domain-containing protein [Thermoanaerobaculia bacterium]